MKRILLILVSMSLLAGAACEKKSEKADEDPAAAAQEADKEQEGEKAEKAAEPEEPEEPEIPEAVTKVDCEAKPEAEGLEVSDKSEDGEEAAAKGDDKGEELPADSPLLNPEKASEQAPEVFWAKLNTTKGPIVMRFEREWSPRGVDRVYNLINMGYYEDIAFFRVIDGFMAQFGIHGNPDVNAVWNPNPKDMPKEEYEKKNAAATIKDDPVKGSNTRGMVTFAKKGIPDSRSVQLFINYADNKRLDESGFAPIGEVAKCMDNVDALHAGYGEGAPRGQGPSQEKMNKQGNDYLQQEFPKLDYIETTEIIAEK